VAHSSCGGCFSQPLFFGSRLPVGEPEVTSGYGFALVGDRGVDFIFEIEGRRRTEKAFGKILSIL